MARLRSIEEHEVAPELRTFYEKDVERYGVVLNNTKVYAHSPAVTTAIAGESIAKVVGRGRNRRHPC